MWAWHKLFFHAPRSCVVGSVSRLKIRDCKSRVLTANFYGWADSVSGNLSAECGLRRECKVPRLPLAIETTKRRIGAVRLDEARRRDWRRVFHSAVDMMGKPELCAPPARPRIPLLHGPLLRLSGANSCADAGFSLLPFQVLSNRETVGCSCSCLIPLPSLSSRWKCASVPKVDAFV